MAGGISAATVRLTIWMAEVPRSETEMISPDRIDPVILGHILGQHRELHAQLIAARAAFGEAMPPDAAEVASTRAMLRGLREHLRGHFEQEERGGFMEESIARMPRLSGMVRDVMADHPRLLGELDALLESLSAQDISRDAWTAARRGFATFADHLVAHERNENAVVQEGYNEDLGLVD